MIYYEVRTYFQRLNIIKAYKTFACCSPNPRTPYHILNQPHVLATRIL